MGIRPWFGGTIAIVPLRQCYVLYGMPWVSFYKVPQAEPIGTTGLTYTEMPPYHAIGRHFCLSISYIETPKKESQP